MEMLNLLIVVALACASADMALNPSWLINLPEDWMSANHEGNVIDAIKAESNSSSQFEEFSDYHLARVDGFTDGEVVDALEHFFWGKKYGIAMELGALDGSPQTRSMTFDFEKSFGWRRILVEGNPTYRSCLRAYSLDA